MKNGTIRMVIDNQKEMTKNQENMQVDIAIIKEKITNIGKQMDEGQIRKENCMVRFGKIEGKLYMASGAIAVLSILALTKSMGMW